MIKNLKHKRGISTIIATVLIVLITVAAVTILWAAVQPLIDQTADLTCFEVSDAVKVDTNVLYTNATSDTLVYVRIERGPNTDALEGMEILLEVGGSTVTISDIDSPVFSDSTSISSTTETNKGIIDVVTNLPTENGAKVYALTLPANTIAKGNEVKVAVAPIVQIEGEKTPCSATSFVDVRNNVP